MASFAAVSNTSPIIGLERIGQLPLMHQVLGSVLLPPAVQRELGSRTTVPPWCAVQALTQPLPPQLMGAGLGPGETEAIALAIESSVNLVILDDNGARMLAASSGLHVMGTLGLLVQAKRSGIVQAIKPIADALIQTGFYVSRRLYEQVLRSVGESP